MTNRLLTLTACLLFFVFLLQPIAMLHAQTETNVEALMQLAAEADQEWMQMRARAEKYAADNNIPLRIELEDGTIIQLMDVVDGAPVFNSTRNIGAARTTRADKNWPGGGMGLDITGAGYTKIGIWDGGRVRTTHQEFNNTGVPRVVQQDAAGAFSTHATHVAGTIVAAGVSANAKGMLYAGELKSYDWNNDINEMSSAAAAGMEVSNHSYGYNAGWYTNSQGNWVWAGNSSINPVEDWKFGFYSTRSRSVDQLAFNAPYYLIVWAAGNDRGEGPPDAGQPGVPEKDGGDDGFDCMNDDAIGKNILTIGAVRQVLDYQSPNQVLMSSFSSWGPADDGRVKPDVVGKGVSVYSSSATSNTSYETTQGTSMAAPNVAGTIAQFQILYQALNSGQRMRAASLKGLTIHTADEAGPHPGPDYMFGWGLVNAARAAEVIIDDTGQDAIVEQVLNNNQTYERVVNVVGGSPMWVTLCWTDQPGIVQGASLNPRTPHLRNDLDLRILGPDGTTYYPWKLDVENPADPATNDSKNFVDNVELVYIAEAQAGDYTILVDHEGTLVGNQQAFSLIISGINDYTQTAQCPGGLNIPNFDPQNAFINQKVEWEAGKYATSYDVYFGTNGGGTQTPTNILNGENVTQPFIQLHLQPSTTYYIKVVPRNNLGPNASCNAIWSFTTMPTMNSFPYLVNVENVTVPNLPEFWQAWNYSDYFDMNWESSSFIGHSGSKSLLVYATSGGQRRAFNNWLVSPPIEVDATREYMVSFYYRAFNPNTAERLKMAWGTQADTNSLSNLAFSAEGFNVAAWTQGQSLLIPDLDGYIFLGFIADNPDGLGVFIDDILIEDWGLVGVEESLEKQVRIQYRDGRVRVQSEFLLEGAEMSIVNSNGQVVMHQRLPETTHFETAVKLSTGVYIIQLRSSTLNKTAKLFIN
jgi:hypothetical protein